MDDEEFAVMEAPERAVTRQRKGRPMKALLIKKWGTNYAGQVLTNVEKGTIPDGVAKFYEDDEATPNDVVRDVADVSDPLAVRNDAIDPDRVAAADKSQKAKLEAAKKAEDKPLDDGAAEEAVGTQNRARAAELQAAKSAPGTAKVKKLSDKDRKRADQGKGPLTK